MEWNESTLSSVKIAKVFSDNQNPILNIDFDHGGDHLLATCPGDESIHLYDSYAGKIKKKIFSKKYGLGMAIFTHRPNNILHTSFPSPSSSFSFSHIPSNSSSLSVVTSKPGLEGNNENSNLNSFNNLDNHAIRYLSLHDNAYLRYFRGHEKKVEGIELCPIDDLFISYAPLDSFRIWDLRTTGSLGCMEVKSPFIQAAIDPQGMIFAVGLENKFLRLYDMRGYEKGPFSVFEIEDPVNSNLIWNKMTFSPDGKEILLASNPQSSNSGGGNVAYIIDSFDGIVKRVLHNPKAMKFSWVPNGKFIASGMNDGTVAIWNSESGKMIINELEGHHPHSISNVKFNPKMASMVTTCLNVAFWLPDV